MSDYSRELGVEFDRVEDSLERVTYPLTNEELLDGHGDTSVDLPDGSATLTDILSPFVDETYTSGDDVRQAVLNMIDERAIGRKYYSDRDPPTIGEERLDDQVSL